MKKLQAAFIICSLSWQAELLDLLQNSILQSLPLFAQRIV
jgi:hypothetical protein